jgi:hypothetical protein
MLSVRILPADHVCGNLLQAIINIGRTLLLLRKRAPDITPSPTEWPTGPSPSFSPSTAIEAVMKAKHLLTNRLHRFTGPISPARDRYIQYLHVGANPSVLNWHRRGLRCRLSTYHSPTFPTNGLHFSPKGPTGLRLSINSLPPDLKGDQALNLTSGSLHSTSIVTYHLSIAWSNDVPPR